MPGWEIIGKEEKNSVSKLFKEGGVLFAHGFKKYRKKYHVREFEKKAKIFFKSKNALAVSSGTAAIKIGLKALGIKKGDLVITQAFNFIATIEAILDIGAKPIIVNVDKTLNMCPIDLKNKMHSKIRAIIPVHMLGVPAELEKILRIAKSFNVPILEDNCESVGAKYKKKYLGNFGEIGIASFDHAKTITCGEGGMIFSKKISLDKFCREYHDHGHENNPQLPRGMDTRKIYGFNYRMTELQGIIGKVQLKKMNYILNENKKRYMALKNNFSKKIEIRKIPNYSKPVFDTFIFFIQNQRQKNKIIKYLYKAGLGTKNLPDAIKWHCSAYWDHALPLKEINSSKKTLEILKKSIAIPILINKKKGFYQSIGKEISKIYTREN
jgi:8-amino-3,8-dideoxy-alpha-D-manno-octulosonate transaminase